ncbi:MAG TPA: hypothetical protein VFH48_17540 [Chloroflexota bacterium]|nr:hypothetical protein [Chloroflexota bacterium]
MFGLLLAVGAGGALWGLWHDPSLVVLPTDLDPLPLALAVSIRVGSAFVAAALWLAMFRSIGASSDSGMRARPT